LHGAPGETLTWEARLVKGGEIRGLVVDETGAPLAGWAVRVEDDPHVPEDHDLDFAETDAEGRFVVQDMHERPHRVELCSPDNREFPVAVARNVRPGTGELRLQVESERWPSVFLAGRVVDELGKPTDGAQLVLGRETLRGGRLHYPDPTGAFELGPLPPGTWLLRAGSPELPDVPSVVLGPRELAPGETWDCGTIVLGRGGVLAVTARGLASGAEPSFGVQREGVFPLSLWRDGDAWRSGPLQAGPYHLQVSGTGVAALRLPFEIRAGETTRLDLDLAAGQLVTIRAHAEGAGEMAQPRLRILDARGEIVLDGSLWFRPDAEGLVHPGDYGTQLALLPGEYRVEVGFDDGPRSTAPFQVAACVAAALDLDLR